MMKEKMVCSLCGSRNVNEERLVRRSINDDTIYEDNLCGYFCRRCDDPVEIMPEREYYIEMRNLMAETMKLLPDMEFIEVNGTIVPIIKPSN